MSNEPLVYIIVLNFNGRQHLEYCLPDLMRTEYSNFRILFVDNASSDDSVAYVRANFPDLEILETGANLGWAGGNNRGIERALAAGAEYVVLANNDIRVHPAWVHSAIIALRETPGAALGGCLVFGDIAPVELSEYERACEQWTVNEYEVTEKFICGMALFVDCRLFGHIGTIDEEYFAYGEETDIEIRAAAAGFKRVLCNAPVWHYSSGTFAHYRLRASYLAIRNNMRLAIKHYSPLRILKTILVVFYIGCWPFYRGDMRNVTIARLRPRNVLINFGLDLYCLAWNVFKLPATWRRRRADYSMIREYLAREGRG